MTIERDKILHFSVCFIVSAIGGLYGISMSAGLAVGKEYGDSKAVGNKWDWLDILADCIGMFIGGVAHYLLYSLWN